MYLLTEWESRTGKYFEWLSFENFENFGLTLIGRDRLTCMAKPQRRIDTKNSSFIFSSQNKKLTIIRKNVTYFFISVHYCHSLIVTTAKKCFLFIYFLFCNKAVQVHLGRTTSNGPVHVNPTNVSFPMVFCGIARVGMDGSYDSCYLTAKTSSLLCNGKGDSQNARATNKVLG